MSNKERDNDSYAAELLRKGGLQNNEDTLEQLKKNRPGAHYVLTEAEEQYQERVKAEQKIRDEKIKRLDAQMAWIRKWLSYLCPFKNFERLLYFLWPNK